MKKTHLKKGKTKNLEKKIEQWKQDGVLLSGGLCHPRPVQPVTLKGEITSTDLLRQMRDDIKP